MEVFLIAHMCWLKQSPLKIVLLVVICILLNSCRSPQANVGPHIEFSSLPEAAEGGSAKVSIIEGRVSGSRPGQQIVLFARSGIWWVQPFVNLPFTSIQPDSTWKNTTHLGTEYAALLVEPGYRPPATTDVLPTRGGLVMAVATAKGRGEAVHQLPIKLHFSGYEWESRQVPSDRGGTNTYDPANASVDASGFLHLRITQHAGQWACAEVFLTRSLGYGTYSFVVSDTAHLEPAAAFSMFTWEDKGIDQNHREVGIEISRWGDPTSKNAQYAVQPFYLPANVARFTAPPGRLTHAFRWDPGRLLFKTFRGSRAWAESKVFADHEFVSGIPTPGGESIRMNLYVFGYSPTPLEHETEVIVEKFEYLP